MWICYVFSCTIYCMKDFFFDWVAHSHVSHASSQVIEVCKVSVWKAFMWFVHQAFSDYQLQQMTSNFIDQFGFNEEEFAEQEEKIEWVTPLFHNCQVLGRPWSYVGWFALREPCNYLFKWRLVLRFSASLKVGLDQRWFALFGDVLCPWKAWFLARFLVNC